MTHLTNNEKEEVIEAAKRFSNITPEQAQKRIEKLMLEIAETDEDYLKEYDRIHTQLVKVTQSLNRNFKLNDNKPENIFELIRLIKIQIRFLKKDRISDAKYIKELEESALLKQIKGLNKEIDSLRNQIRVHPDIVQTLRNEMKTMRDTIDGYVQVCTEQRLEIISLQERLMAAHNAPEESRSSLADDHNIIYPKKSLFAWLFK